MKCLASQLMPQNEQSIDLKCLRIEETIDIVEAVEMLETIKIVETIKSLKEKDFYFGP